MEFKLKDGISGVIILGFFLILILAFLSFETSYTDSKGVVGIDNEYVADFSDDRVLVGASHDVFVGKVVEQVGTKGRGIGPETQFAVEIIENIKGTLSGTVIVDQQGGYQNGVLYVVGDDSAHTSQTGQDYLLQQGGTYLFATRYNPQENWYTLNSYPTATKLLTSDSSLTDGQLKSLADTDSRVNALKEAYPNEIPLEEDIAANNALNSYKALQATSTQEQPESGLTEESSQSDNPNSGASADTVATSSDSVVNATSATTTTSTATDTPEGGL